jgi:hypothetical protein
LQQQLVLTFGLSFLIVTWFAYYATAAAVDVWINLFTLLLIS